MQRMCSAGFCYLGTVLSKQSLTCKLDGVGPLIKHLPPTSFAPLSEERIKNIARSQNAARVHLIRCRDVKLFVRN